MAPYEQWAAFNSYASPSPAIEEGRVYAHFGSAGTACLDTATGKVLWKRTDLKCGHHRGPASSPILWENLLILTFDGFDVQYLAALDKNHGQDRLAAGPQVPRPGSQRRHAQGLRHAGGDHGRGQADVDQSVGRGDGGLRPEDRRRRSGGWSTAG